MVALCVLLTFAVFIGIDYARTVYAHRKAEIPRGAYISTGCTVYIHRKAELPRGAYISTGFEALGALCNDGGTKVEKK